MKVEQLLKQVKETLKGASFEQLAQYFKEFEESGYYNAEIDLAIMDEMEALDEVRFLEWANEQE